MICADLSLRTLASRLRHLGPSTALGVVLAAAGVSALAGLAAAGEMGPTPSDWNDLNWRELETSRAAYICLSDSPATWCGDWWDSRTDRPLRLTPEDEDGMAEAAPPPPAKAVSDARWQEVLERIAVAPPSRADFLYLSLRALQDSDPAAMEVLAYAYALGRGVDRDYAKAYEYYGRVFYSGLEHVKPNLDQLWAFLTDEERLRLTALFAPGTVPDRL